ncbi:MAG: NAD-dependent epimerase/dehydratase family protein [Planctomycetota bacterium]|jgi:nucleoside-diphosphate-sugar epimerase
MRLLVTGAGGFIGRQCLPLAVERGFEVHGVAAPDEAPGTEDVHWHRLDLLAPGPAEALVHRLRPTHLLHLAWITTPGAYWQAPENETWSRRSAVLFDAFAAAGGARLVATGSCAEYDWTSGVCDERSTPLALDSAYAANKHALHLHLQALAEAKGLSHAWARVFFLYGPDEHPDRLVPSIVRSLLAGRPAACTAGTQRRDFLHVADAAGAIVALLASPVEGAVNIGSGTAPAVSRVATRIGALMSRPDLVRLGARPTPADEPPLVVADVRRLREEVGFEPRYDLDAGLVDAIAWWRSLAADAR